MYRHRRNHDELTDFEIISGVEMHLKINHEKVNMLLVRSASQISSKNIDNIAKLIMMKIKLEPLRISTNAKFRPQPN